MPITYHIDPGEGVAYLTETGVITFADLTAARQALLADPLFRPAISLLIDARNAEDIALDGEEMKSFASESILGVGARRAIVAKKNAVFGVARMFERLSESGPIAVFHTMDDATDWLGIARRSE